MSNRKVIFNCTLEEESSKEELDKDESITNQNEIMAKDEDECSLSSDDSYVKVFASSSSQDLAGFIFDVGLFCIYLSIVLG